MGVLLNTLMKRKPRFDVNSAHIQILEKVEECLQKEEGFVCINIMNIGLSRPIEATDLYEWVNNMLNGHVHLGEWLNAHQNTVSTRKHIHACRLAWVHAMIEFLKEKKDE